MQQLVVLSCARLRVENGDLLIARMKITAYYDHPGSFLPPTLVSNPTTVYRDVLEPSPLSNQSMRWVQKTVEPAAVARLAVDLRDPLFPPLKDPLLATTLARLLVMRGITEPEAAQYFLTPSISQLHSPYLMTGMKDAVDRIEGAIERKESILIYGDYDVDGTMAIVILKTA